MIRLAEAHHVDLDYLLLDKVARRPLDLHISRLAERVMGLEALTEKDERALLHILELLEARAKLEELAAAVGQAPGVKEAAMQASYASSSSGKGRTAS